MMKHPSIVNAERLRSSFPRLRIAGSSIPRFSFRLGKSEKPGGREGRRRREVNTGGIAAAAADMCDCWLYSDD